MTPPRTRPAVTWWEWLLVAALTAGAAWLRLHRLDAQGMWLDEAFSVWMARQPVGDLFHWITRVDQHPPLYYLLLNGWMRLAGDGESGVRSLSVLLGAATVPLLYMAARRLMGRASAVAAALLLALAPFHVRFAQEARMYTLYTLNATLALAALAYLLTGDRRRRWWALYIVASALTLLSHNTSVLFWVAVNVAVGAVALISRRQARPGDLEPPSLRAWLIAQGLIFLLWLPWLPSFVRQAQAVDNEFWIQPPTGATIAATAQTLLLWNAPLDANYVWVALGMVLALALLALARRPALLTWLLLLAATPFVLELLISLRRPIFYDRTLIWTAVPLLLLLAGSLSWPTAPGERGPAPMVLASVGVAGMVVGSVLALQTYFDNFRKEEWREAAAWVAERVQPGDMLLFNATWVQIPFQYYFDRTGKDATMHGAPVDLFDAGILEPKMTDADVPRLEQLAAQADCVWLVYSHDWYTDPEKIVPATLRSAMRSIKGQKFVGLEVQLYQRRGADLSCGQPAN